MLRNRWCTTLLIALLSLCLSQAFQPAQAAVPDIQIPVGQSFVLTIPEGIVRVAIGDPEVAEAVTLPGNDRDVVINTHKAGFTNLLIWSTRGVQQKLVEVTANRRTEQIVIRVRVLEVSQSKDGRYGFKWNESIVFSEATPNMPFRLGLPSRNTNLQLIINTLVNEGKARVLAQPTLVAMNGEAASFSAGGEFPVQSSSGTGADRVSRVEWKPFGVMLKITPRVEGTDTIGLKLTAEVSNIDRANGIVEPDGVVVPGIARRVADTTVMLKDGETLVIAGLMQEIQQEVVSKIPVLGDIPGFGALFRSTQIERKQNELVFILTPTILKGTQVVPEMNYGQEK